MLISFIRTLILLLAVVAALRLMGKRQIGQLQPSELVVTILLSQVAASPMQDNDISLLNTLVVMAVLAGAEVLLSALALKNIRVRRLLDGSPVVLVRDGVPDQAQMRRLRYTLHDLTEALRAKGVFDLNNVRIALAETDGSVSVLLKTEAAPAPLAFFEKEPRDGGMPVMLIADGTVLEDGLREAGLDRAALEGILRKERVRAADVFLLTCDAAGKRRLIRKERAGV